MSKTKDGIINLRVALADKIAGRADALVEKMSKDPVYAAFRISRAAALRIALLKGIADLEQQYGVKSKR
jgi:hypothetical protein